jgi:carbamoyltransferase
VVILGLSGSLFLPQDPVTLDPLWWHDAAAVLVKDGAVVAAVEEERLSRAKHTNRFPQWAISACLTQAGIGPDQVDCIAYYQGEDHARGALRAVSMSNPAVTDTNPASVLRGSFARAVGFDYVGPLEFVNHHRAHAASAHRLSGWSDCLVLTIDGRGDRESGLVIDVRENRWEVLRELTIADSLGIFYERLIGFIGYWKFEEYKVMSLASYGDPTVYRKLFRGLYELLPEGQFIIRQSWDDDVVLHHYPPRRRHEPIQRKDMDFAAGLQEALEDLVGHLLRHYRAVTGHRRLAMAGGVALNCAMTGRLLLQEMFDDIFVQPASNDAGCALGAALYSTRWQEGQVAPQMEHCYWGPSLPAADQIEVTVKQWDGVVSYRWMTEPFDEVAALLAKGAIIGWAQGRLEFGPRALGNRSILADARFPAASARINSIVKKRDNFQPFAPSVLEEELHTYFELPSRVRTLPFMVFTARVKSQYREKLGAITHVDGTARVQTVSRKHNPRYWSLIRAMGQHTGFPIVLNTSFNNQAEPIVHSVEDALTCLVSTELDYLVVEDLLISKRADAAGELWNFHLSLRPGYELWHRPGRSQAHVIRRIGSTEDRRISPELYALLSSLEGSTIAQSADEAGLGSHRATLMSELLPLWNARIVRVAPRSEMSGPPCKRAP